MYRIERQHEGPTRGHWLPVKGATHGTREGAATALREIVAAEGRSKTERFRIALAAVTACLVLQ